MKYRLLLVIFIIAFTFSGCSGVNSNTEKENPLEEYKYGDTAEYLSYEDNSLYIAGLKTFEEFGDVNEGSFNVNEESDYVTFSMIKGTESNVGAVTGPKVYFKMTISTREIIESEFEEYNDKVIELNDERMIEIAEFFMDLVNEMEE